MASDLIETARVETLVQSGLPAAELELFVDAADADIIRAAGPHDGSQKIVVRKDPSSNLYLPRPAVSIEEVKEWHDAGIEENVDPLPASEYSLLGNGRYLRRRSGLWRWNVAVTFVPLGDDARRIQVLIDLVKWELARRGYTRERTGQYEAYTGKGG